MRNASLLVTAVMLLLVASPGFADLGDPTAPAGIVVGSEPDAIDPALVWFVVTWEEPAPLARLTVQGPGSLHLVGAPGERWELLEADPAPGSAKHVLVSRDVAAGDQARFMIGLGNLEEGDTALVVAQRVLGRTTFQVQVSIDILAEGPRVSAPASYRVTDVPRRAHATTAAVDPWLEGGLDRPVTDPAGGTVVVESLDAKTATHAEFFQQDTVGMGITDGPFNCADSNVNWHIIRDIYVNSVPNETVDSITLHLSITHPQTYDLQIGYFYYGLQGAYLWRHGAGTNIETDFTSDYYGNALPGLGHPVNSNYRVTVRDCYAGNTGTFNYWTLRIQYGGGGGGGSIDLLASSLSAMPTNIQAGSSTTVAWGGNVTGTGTVSGPFSVNFYLSLDASITTSDTLLHSESITSAVNPGDTFGSSGTSMVIPSGTAAGTYYIGMFVDAGGVIAEDNEDNNKLATPVTITSGGGGGGGCTADATTMCLNNDRFKVTCQWATNQPSSGSGQAVELTNDTGYFWFFNSANVEMVIKVLNGCGVNGKYWVYAGGLTNVQVNITVEDTQTQQTKTYTNPMTTPFQPIQDSSAFATCP